MIRKKLHMGKTFLGIIVFVFLVCFVPTKAYASECTLIEEKISYSTPEYICVVPNNPSSDYYRYYIDDNGDICITNADNVVFAKECSQKTEDSIYVFEKTSNGKLTQMTDKKGNPICVSLIH